MAAALAATILGSSAYHAYTGYHLASARAERETLNASRILVEHTARTFEAISRALDEVAEIRSDFDSGKLPPGASVHDLLKAVHGGSPVLLGIGWTDEAGNRLYSSLFRDPPPLNIAGQEHFKVHADAPNAGPHIAAPVRSRLDGSWLFGVSRRFNDTNGRFAGVVNAVIRLDYFNSFYRTIDLGLDRTVLLTRTDGALLVHEPVLPNWLGRSLAGSPWFHEHMLRAGSGTFRATSPMDGLTRIVGYGTVPGLPLLVGATMSADHAMAAYYERLRGEALRAGLMLAAIIVGAAALFVLLRRQAEAMAVKSLLANVVESSNDAIITRDMDGRITSWNPGAARMFGRTREEAIGEPVAMLIPPDRKEEQEGIRRSIARGESIIDSETVRLRKDGTTVDISLTVTPLRDAQDGAIIGASSISRDITERKRREAELRGVNQALAEKSALLETVFATSSQGVAVFDQDLRLVAWNEHLAKIYDDPAAPLHRGVSLEERLRAIASKDEFGEGGVDQFVAERMATARSRQGKRYERRRPNGMVVDVQWTPLKNGYLAVSHMDITDQKRVEAALRESEERLAEAHTRLTDAIESLSDGFLLWDAEDRLVLFNQAAVRVHAHRGDPKGEWLKLGVTFGEIIERRARAGLIPAAKGHEEEYVCERVERHRNPTGAPVELHFADGHWESIRERRTREGGVVAIRTDITPIKRREIELAAAREAAESANRAKSDFLSRMSHELRTPLNAVIGFAQMLELDRPKTLTDAQKDYCRHIEQGGHHLLALVNEILDLARVESGNLKMSMERVSVAGALASVRDTMAPLAEKTGVALNISDHSIVPDVRADDLRLRQVLINLVSNAIKYNRPGGSVGISAMGTPGGRVRFIVLDTGSGIAPEMHKDIFTPFHRGEAEFTVVEGTGIGLAITKRLVEAMDGTIGFTSVPGQGSTFWVEFPLNTARTEDGGLDAAGVPTLSRAAAGGYSLLYVEDNPVNLRLMEHLVSTLPNVVMLSAATPRLGIDLAVAHRPSVIVLDLNMPEMNGLEMLERLKAMRETADIPVLALTATAMPNDIARGVAAGFFRYLTKPLDVKTFLAAVDAALDAHGERLLATA